MIDTNLFVAAVKNGKTRSTELLVRLIDGPSDLVADDILISNDAHFNGIKEEGVIEVWSITDAIKTLL